MPDPYDQTPLLSLPYIQGGQAQKHVTHNEALERLDMLVQLTVEAVDINTPPGGAVEGQAWTVGAAPTGAWASNAGDIAAWRGGNWLFVSPQIGWRIWDKSGAGLAVYDGTTWAATGGGVASFENLPGVGVNATSDTTNRLAVSSPATLLNHDGAGHQLKVNKNAPADTASLLYQSNWSGRAEMGLAGNDDFSIKVSADGSSFTESLRIDAASGKVSMPQTGGRTQIPHAYRYYIYADKRWTAPSANSGSMNATQSLGTGAEPSVDWDAKGIFVRQGSVLNGFSLAGSANNAEITHLDLRIYFQYGPWNAPWNSSGGTTRTMLHSENGAALLALGGLCNLYLPFSYTAPADGYLAVAMRADAASTLGATRYFYSAGALDVTLPPSA